MKRSYYNNPEYHPGTQPIRVLYQNFKHWFENTHEGFEVEILEAIEEKGFHPEFRYIQREERVNVLAQVGTFKIINVEESFLAFLWCISYGLVGLYDETVQKPRITENYERTEQIIKLVNEAHQLIQYGLSLLYGYNPWDKENLPNPEFYDRDENEYIDTANGVFLSALNFVIVHEFAHIVMGHIDEDIERQEAGDEEISNEEKIAQEHEADAFAFEKLIQGADNITNLQTVSLGLVAGLSSLIFFNNTMDGGDHPDPDHRLQYVLEHLNLPEEDNLWGIACMAIRLWANHYNIDLRWPRIVDTYKELFENSMNRIQELK